MMDLRGDINAARGRSERWFPKVTKGQRYSNIVWGNQGFGGKKGERFDVQRGGGEEKLGVKTTKGSTVRSNQWPVEEPNLREGPLESYHWFKENVKLHHVWPRARGYL